MTQMMRTARKDWNMVTVGTSHFVSLAQAETYYRGYGFSRSDVGDKIKAGEIHIGKPTLSPGQRLTVLDGGKRYGIEER